MAQQDAVKKAPKKSPAKSAGKHDPKKAGKDARRTFEHLGRVRALSGLAHKEQASIQELLTLADTTFRSQQYKASAELLRAAEHLGFADVARDDREAVSSELATEIENECKHLAERAKEHGNAENSTREVHTLFKRVTTDAHAALNDRAYRAALELARCADALTHVGELNGKALPDGGTTKRLES